MDKAYHDLLHGVKGKPVIVAIIDSGVEADHEDLKSRMWNNR
jgi:subtilisin family serine protease